MVSLAGQEDLVMLSQRSQPCSMHRCMFRQAEGVWKDFLWKTMPRIPFFVYNNDDHCLFAAKDKVVRLKPD